MRQGTNPSGSRGVESLLLRRMPTRKLSSRAFQFKVFAVLFSLALWPASVLPESQRTTQRPQFRLFDGTLYVHKPSLSEFGIEYMQIIYGGKFWDTVAERKYLPRKERVVQLASEAHSRGAVAVIDIEVWPLKGDSSTIRDSVAKYLAVLNWFHNTAPNLLLGYYGSPPIRDYWRAVKGEGTKEYLEWQMENDRLKVLADSVDVLFPSLYTFYEDQRGWLQYAKAQIQEARRYAKNKPIYVFIWPQYHDSNRLLGGHYLPADYWRLELETVRQLADGAVIWGGWDLKANRPAEWDDKALWWQVTKEFAKDLKQ